MLISQQKVWSADTCDAVCCALPMIAGKAIHNGMLPSMAIGAFACSTSPFFGHRDVLMKKTCAVELFWVKKFA